MSETHLIVLLYILTLIRLVTYLKPTLLSETLQRQVSEGIDSIVYAGVAALFLIHFVVRSYWIPSESMTKTLLVNDYILVNEVQYRISRPMRGDIAVFHPPKNYTGDKTDLIKRVVGLEGDVIEVKDGALYRNEAKIEEAGYVWEPIDNYFPPHRVAPGCCFMMGDNRNNSHDSRYFGDVPLENYVGRAEVIFWPLNRARILH